MSNCLESLYSILYHLIEVYYKVLEYYISPMSRYPFVRFLRYIFHYTCFQSHNTFPNSYKHIPK